MAPIGICRSTQRQVYEKNIELEEGGSGAFIIVRWTAMGNWLG